MGAPIDYVNPPATAPAQGLYSHVGVARPDKPLLFVSGQLSVDLDGTVVGRHDFEAQFHQVFGNLEAVLKGLGGDLRNVVKFTTIFVHSQDIEHFMRLRAENFPKWYGDDQPFPPNTILVVDRLVKEDFLFEVEAVAQI